jgi:nucleolar MIF4G domain-containing protein 1
VLIYKQILNFVYLQDKTSSFLEVLLVTALQVIDRRCKSKTEETKAAVSQVFGKAKNAPQMVPGLQYFLTKSVQVSTLVSPDEKAALKRTSKAAVDAMMLLDFASADFEVDS